MTEVFHWAVAIQTLACVSFAHMRHTWFYSPILALQLHMGFRTFDQLVNQAFVFACVGTPDDLECCCQTQADYCLLVLFMFTHHPYLYRFSCRPTYIHTYASTYIHANTHACMYTHMYEKTRVYVHTYIHPYIHTYTHIHTYIHTHTNKQTYIH